MEVLTWLIQAGQSCFGEQPSAAKWNILGSNDASFNDGTGIANLTIGATTAVENSYKFSVYRNAAQNGGNAAFALVQFDTKTFDTGTNVDVVTNKGRFTAPIAGFYHFDAWLTFAAASADGYIVAIYKNGSILRQGNQGFYAGSTTTGAGVSANLSLAANDYIEIYLRNGGGAITVGNSIRNYFEGFLISTT